MTNIAAESADVASQHSSPTVVENPAPGIAAEGMSAEHGRDRAEV
jgi:hypothetical protein